MKSTSNANIPPHSSFQLCVTVQKKNVALGHSHLLRPPSYALPAALCTKGGLSGCGWSSAAMPVGTVTPSLCWHSRPPHRGFPTKTLSLVPLPGWHPVLKSHLGCCGWHATNGDAELNPLPQKVPGGSWGPVGAEEPGPWWSGQPAPRGAPLRA